MFYVINVKKQYRQLLAALLVILSIAAVIAAIVVCFPAKHIELINKYSEKYGLEPALVCAVIRAESGFDENAVSNRGASGLMQLMNTTADWANEKIDIDGYSYDRILEPDINIEIGCWFLAKLMQQYDGNISLVLSAYNAGSGNVAKWLYSDEYSFDSGNADTIPFKETSDYVKRVGFNYKVYKHLLPVYNKAVGYEY